VAALGLGTAAARRSDFSTEAQAQAFYNRYFPYYGDFARLDGNDNDGRVCESLP
jgi:hypothetical protein